MTAAQDVLPPLPEPLPRGGVSVHLDDSRTNWIIDNPCLYAPDDMREYGLACFRAGMESAAKVCDAVQANYTHHYTKGAKECASQIRGTTHPL